MSRSKRLKAFCKGRVKRDVAMKHLKIEPLYLSYLLKHDIDKLIARIDKLPVNK